MVLIVPSIVPLRETHIRVYAASVRAVVAVLGKVLLGDVDGSVHSESSLVQNIVMTLRHLDLRDLEARRGPIILVDALRLSHHAPLRDRSVSGGLGLLGPFVVDDVWGSVERT